jgi:type II secretory pathway pseudopilin PulG
MRALFSSGAVVLQFLAATRGPGVKRARLPRRGTSLLEVQIAFALLGVGLAGLAPLVVMQLRQVRQLELRLQGQVMQTTTSTGTSQMMLPGQTYYIVPWQNAWAQKLAGSGQILTSAMSACDPGPLTVPPPAPIVYPVNVVELDAAPGSQNLTAYVDVSAP